MAIVTNLDLYRGEDVVLPYDVDEDISGWTLATYISDRYEDTTPVLTLAVSITNAANGLCESALTAAETLGLTGEVYYWELARTTVGAVAVLARGTLTVRSRVPA